VFRGHRVTTTVATMNGWIVHRYLYCPGLVKVNVKLSPGFSVGDLNSPVVSVTSCASPSRLVQLTVVPTTTDRLAGLNAKLKMLTELAATTGGLFWPVLAGGGIAGIPVVDDAGAACAPVLLVPPQPAVTASRTAPDKAIT
jgi:hypothetical protein